MDDPPWGASASSTAPAEAAGEEEGREDEEREEKESDGDEEEEWIGCAHYKRRCQIVAPCCGEVFWCRHCHNEEKDTGEEGGHEIDRRAIREVICQTCGIRVESAQHCSSCGECFAEYFCEICNFWDDEGLSKMVFHCDGCGICRVGGRDNFFHCDTCGSCYPIECADFHTCVEQAMHQNCPVCLQGLFQSTTEVRVLHCGHTIHQDCLRQLQMSFAGLQSLRCPICNSSLNRHDDVWEELDRQIQETPMPPEYHDVRVAISCNDCQQSAQVLFHILGHKCPHCGSFNTRRE